MGESNRDTWVWVWITQIFINLNTQNGIEKLENHSLTCSCMLNHVGINTYNASNVREGCFLESFSTLLTWTHRLYSGIICCAKPQSPWFCLSHCAPVQNILSPLVARAFPPFCAGYSWWTGGGATVGPLGAEGLCGSRQVGWCSSIIPLPSGHLGVVQL